MSKKKAKNPAARAFGKLFRNPAKRDHDLSVNELGFAKIHMPEDEKMVVKEVPAKVDGVVVGTAQIYEDGSVGVIMNEDAPQWAKDKIQSTADMLGYSIGTEL